ncbi:DUF397 domain-containing protein [Nocardia sp. NPDC059240]|uniref:DUF397 domain-containing protein n=1 Tax=Nocardia sp. NPDC059240 TaxID=3346786 RepID=UPI0036A230E6
MSERFYKSTYSGSNQACVEISHRRDEVLIRDSKYTGPADLEPILTVPADAWSAVLDLAMSMTSGEIDGELTITVHPDGGATIAGQDGVTLDYRADEWDAFAKGVAAGQFDR